MKKYFLVIAFVFLYYNISFGATTFILDSEFLHQSDSDDETITSVGGGGTYLIDKKGLYSLLGGSIKFDDNISTETFNFLRLNGKTSISESFTLNSRFTIYESNSWSPFVFGGSVIYNPNNNLRLEIYGDREIVDSTPAIRQKYYIDAYGISLDYVFSSSFTAVGAFSFQNISDGNDRNIGILKLIYQPQKYDWLSIVLSNRYLNGEFRSPFYFSPDSLFESLIIAQIKKPVWNEKFLLTIKGGLGKQFVRFDNGSDVSRIASLLEAGIKGWFTNHLGLEIHSGYQNNSDTFGAYERYSIKVALRYAL